MGSSRREKGRKNLQGEDPLAHYNSRFILKIGQLLFRLRSLTPVPFILILVYFSHSTLSSIAIGSPLLVCGEWLRAWAVGYAGASTRARTLGAARALVTTGPYAHVRNPLYLGNLLLSLGMCCIANVYWMIAVLLVGYLAQYLPIIASEERYLFKACGTTYQAYFAAVPRLLPRLRPYSNPSVHDFSFSRALKSEKRTLTAIVSVLALIAGKVLLF